MYQVKFLIISHHVTPNIMCRVVFGKIAAAGSQAAFATTRSRMCTRPSLSLLTHPHGGNLGAQHIAAAILFLVWVRGYCPFFSFLWNKATPLELFFRILAPGGFWINLTHHHDGRAEGAWGFATLTKYLATNVESPKSRGTLLPAVLF